MLGNELVQYFINTSIATTVKTKLLIYIREVLFLHFVRANELYFS
jgi:hypothetical protein